MKSIKVNLMFWVAGWVAGVVLMERWRRHGGRYVPVESVEAVAASTASAATPSASDDKPRISALIVAGAKADAERARRLLKQAMPWRSDSVA